MWGPPVRGPGGEEISEVEDLVLQDARVTHVVGGFLGLESKSIALALDQVGVAPDGAARAARMPGMAPGVPYLAQAASRPGTNETD